MYRWDHRILKSLSLSGRLFYLQFSGATTISSSNLKRYLIRIGSRINYLAQNLKSCFLVEDLMLSILARVYEKCVYVIFIINNIKLYFR
ncbi:hypothetical protein SAMN04487764_0910 [Gillisia sp. Hel1_33_143]|nr:hypothetical protein SAMN04487764_0910 [Gillisia sp. Hel1_33_143]